MGSVALALITDGRQDYLLQTLASATSSLLADWSHTQGILVNDSGSDDYADFLDECFVSWKRCHHWQRFGFAASVRTAWTAALAYRATHIVHLEDDFTFNEPVDLNALIDLLHRNKQLAQIALKRQPVNDQERAVGGFMETRSPETWRQRDGFVEHGLNFTTNPCVIPAHAARVALLSGVQLTEPNISEVLLDAGYTFGYLGRVEDPPLVTHIGDERTAGWLQ